jgi:hypothetical protein
MAHPVRTRRSPRCHKLQVRKGPPLKHNSGSMHCQDWPPCIASLSKKLLLILGARLITTREQTIGQFPSILRLVWTCFKAKANFQSTPSQDLIDGTPCQDPEKSEVPQAPSEKRYPILKHNSGSMHCQDWPPCIASLSKKLLLIL